jgi:hypothetical protein
MQMLYVFVFVCVKIVIYIERSVFKQTQACLNTLHSVSYFYAYTYKAAVLIFMFMIMISTISIIYNVEC